MKCKTRVGDRWFEYESTRFQDVSIPLDFKGPQVNFFNVDHASASPYKSGEVIGNTAEGGSCNFDTITFIPHCCGTHTECVGHIVNDGVYINTILPDTLIPASLVSIETIKKNRGSDKIIPKDELESKLLSIDNDFKSALVIRTLPNSETKLSARYDVDNLPAYLEKDAMALIIEHGFDHLLVDLPSIDRAYDEGRLECHRLFWGLPQGAHDLDGIEPSHRTITELSFVPNDIKDGNYLLQLQITNFIRDAAPSRPLLFSIVEQ